MGRLLKLDETPASLAWESFRDYARSALEGLIVPFGGQKCRLRFSGEPAEETAQRVVYRLVAIPKDDDDVENEADNYWSISSLAPSYFRDSFIEKIDEIISKTTYIWREGVMLNEADRSIQYARAAIFDYKTFFVDSAGIFDVFNQAPQHPFVPPVEIVFTDPGNVVSIKINKNYSALFYDLEGKEEYIRVDRSLMNQVFSFFLLSSNANNHAAREYFSSTIQVFKSMASHGGGLGAARCDAIDETDHYWAGNRLLGYALGLKEDQYRDLNYVADNLFEFLDDGYSVTNIPWERDTHTPTAKKTIIRMGSEILYLKRFKADYAGKKNKPRGGVPAKPRIPILKSLGHDNEELYLKVSDVYRKKVKSKDLLHDNARERSAANAAIYGGYKGTAVVGRFTTWLAEQIDKTSQDTSWSATDFSRFVVSEIGGLPVVVTDQEWCHLFGHGDGGWEGLDNFVAGSKHCNSEQLAIETGQRKGGYSDLSANVTAYLFPIDDVIVKTEIPGGDMCSLIDRRFPDDERAAQKRRIRKTYFKANDAGLWRVNDVTWTLRDNADEIEQHAMEEVLDPLTSPERQHELREEGRIVSYIFAKSHWPFPYAKEIRYKIFFKKKKIFDHVFDAQCQSFNYHEFKILRTAVESAVARGTGRYDGFKDAIDEKLDALGIDDRYNFSGKIVDKISEVVAMISL